MKSEQEFSRLVNILETLRGPGGCPWDKKQTHESLIKYLREESFEVIESIFAGDSEGLCEELGDLILQVILHSVIAKERGAFTITDVLCRINQKLIHRHPHVFDEDHVQKHSLEEQWEALKNKEKKGKVFQGCFESVPDSMDPWLKAERVQLIAENDKFEWENKPDLIDKIIEECGELKEAKNEDKGRVKEELGDLLFSVINLCRYMKMNPSELIEDASSKFSERYDLMVEFASMDNPEIRFKKLSLDEKEKYWQKAKMQLKDSGKLDADTD